LDQKIGVVFGESFRRNQERAQNAEWRLAIVKAKQLFSTKRMSIKSSGLADFALGSSASRGVLLTWKIVVGDVGCF